MSAAQFMPKTEHPHDIAEAVRTQALWIERQNQTNATHWGEINRLETDCGHCRGDRRLEGQLPMAAIEDLKKRVTEIQAGTKMSVIVGRAAFALAGLLVAAYAAGMLR